MLSKELFLKMNEIEDFIDFFMGLKGKENIYTWAIPKNLALNCMGVKRKYSSFITFEN